MKGRCQFTVSTQFRHRAIHGVRGLRANICTELPPAPLSGLCCCSRVATAACAFCLRFGPRPPAAPLTRHAHQAHHHQRLQVVQGGGRVGRHQSPTQRCPCVQPAVLHSRLALTASNAPAQLARMGLASPLCLRVRTARWRALGPATHHLITHMDRSCEVRPVGAHPGPARVEQRGSAACEQCALGV